MWRALHLREKAEDTGGTDFDLARSLRRITLGRLLIRALLHVNQPLKIVGKLRWARMPNVALKHKTTIKVESHKLLIVRSEHSPVELWCAECDATVQMVTPGCAAVLRATSPRRIYSLVENGELHFVESIGGELFICCRSLHPEQLSLLDHNF